MGELANAAGRAETRRCRCGEKSGREAANEAGARAAQSDHGCAPSLYPLRVALGAPRYGFEACCLVSKGETGRSFPLHAHVAMHDTTHTRSHNASRKAWKAPVQLRAKPQARSCACVVVHRWANRVCSGGSMGNVTITINRNCLQPSASPCCAGVEALAVGLYHTAALCADECMQWPAQCTRRQAPAGGCTTIRARAKASRFP